MMGLPPVRPAPCFDCPWRRNAAKGWLGPFTAEEWLATAHSDEPIACHITLNEDAESEAEAWSAQGVLQCAGSAIYRSNVHKSPRNPEVATLPADLETVFGMGEFVPYHTQ